MARGSEALRGPKSARRGAVALAGLLVVLVAAAPSIPARSTPVPRVAMSMGCCVDPGGVLLLEPDGVTRRIASVTGTMASRPTWSPDGTKIAYSSHGLEGSQLRVLDVETGRESSLADLPGRATFEVEWAPNGDWIAFSGTAPTVGVWGQPYVEDLFLINLDTGAPIPVRVGAGSPAWAPDGLHLAYVSAFGLEVVHVDSFGPSHPELLVPASPDGSDSTVIRNLSWSNEGDRLAFVSYSADMTAPWSRAEVELRVVGLDGRLVGLGVATHSAVDWSPDDRHVAFSGERGLETIASEGGGAPALVVGLDPAEVTGLDVGWSADGRWLVQSRSNAGICCHDEVWLVGVTADGAQRTGPVEQHLVGEGRGLMRFTLAPGH